jgi:predicted dehydrogenase
MKELRVGMIGCGDISHRHMMIYASIQKRAETLGFTAKVVAVAEVRPDRLKAWGEQYGFDSKDLYTDYRELLKRGDIDTIDVCAHNNLHVPISIEAMKAGLDVYCEKPSAASYRDAKMMVDCAAKLGRKYHVQMSSLMTNQTRKIKSLIENGDIGVPYYVNLEQCSARRRPGYDLPMYSNDFYSKRMAGHGPSIDMGVYLIGQILFVLGTPTLKSVTGFARQAMELDQRLVSNPDGFGVEDIADGFAKFENGVGFHFLASSANNYKDYSFTYILGSKGGLELIDTDTIGGKLANRGFARLGERFMAPNVKFYGRMGQHDVHIDFDCDRNQDIEERLDPKMLMYNDNQVMWLAYKLGILDDNTRYNTPEIAMQQLMFTDGLFLSEELGRTVTADEILAMSPTLYVTEQEIDGKLHKFDLEF